MIGLWPSIVMNGWPGDLIADCRLRIADCTWLIAAETLTASADSIGAWKFAASTTSSPISKVNDFPLSIRLSGGRRWARDFPLGQEFSAHFLPSEPFHSQRMKNE